MSVIDGFSGTGTFIARLIGEENGARPHHLPADVLRRKWAANEFHANEIELLPHMIGVANIETAYAARTGGAEPFAGAVLTDTFEGTGRRDLLTLEDEVDGIAADAVENQRRRCAQQEDIIEVFVSNPPWNAYQGKGGERGRITERVRETFTKHGNAKQRTSNYNDYRLAIRQALDRINDQTGYGVIAFVTDGGWLDARSADGFRKCLADEASVIRVVNLKGNAATSGEDRQNTGDTIFEQASRSRRPSS